jgi:DNA-binding IscR family transcriptional regulator
VHGGWRLERDPEHITLLAVYQATNEGQLLSMHHSDPNPHCLIGRNIQRTLTVYFDEAELAFTHALSQRTVAHVLQTASEDPTAPIA